MIRLPPPLRPGARVGVFAPSHPFEPERLDASMALLGAWGLEPVPAPGLGARWRHFAGTDAQRLADLRWALTDPSLDAAWMARGGSGLPRLFDGLPWDTLPDRPVVGFSDGTALHVALRRRAGLAGVHGPVLHSLADGVDDATRERLRALLFGEREGALTGRVLRAGEARGPLVGGNLCVLASLCGGPDQLDARGAILLLEEVAEPPYKVDRLLTQLRQAGVFEGIVGLALGSFTGTCVPEGAGWSVHDLALEALGDLDVPVLADLPVGHGRQNHPFLHGAPVHLQGERLSWSLTPCPKP